MPLRLNARFSHVTTAPRFNIVGSTAELYAPSRFVVPNSPSRPREKVKVQKRWLSNSHPEAFIGGAPAFSSMLKDTIHHSEHSEYLQDEGNILAMGEMTDMTIPSRPTGIPLLAVATGESGQKLRLVRVDKSQWQWGEHQDASLLLSVVDTAQQEEETIWIGDGLPIVNVKFVTSFWQSGRARWLLVQTRTSVTLLQPEYHPVPVPNHSRSSSYAFQASSHVDPTPLITLHHHETGGNEISDVWFDPASVGALPRLGVIDQCGYWSVWSLLGTWKVSMNTLRFSLHKCGHISEGFLSSLPRLSAYPAQRHGMLRIGRTGLGDILDMSMNQEQKSKNSDASSHHVLIWNAQQIVLLDLERERLLPKLDIVRQSRLARDWIIGVESSPANGDQIFVLTARQVIWLDLSLTRGEAEPVMRPTLLLACSHVGFGNEDSRMSTCRASEDDPNNTMVFIYSPQVNQLTVYWFGSAPETQLPQYHRHITSLFSGEKKTATSKVQLIRVYPAKLETSEASGEPGPGAQYMRNDVKFYQVTILNEDLSVRYCICASSADPALEVNLPTLRVNWSPSRERRRRKRKRRRFLKRLEDTFVIPDTMTDESMDILLGRKGPNADNNETLDKAPLSRCRPLPLKVDRICEKIASSLLGMIDQGACGLPTDMIPMVKSTIEHGMLEDGLVPLTSWMQLFSSIQESISYGELNDGMEPDIRNLLESTGDHIVITQLRRRAADELPSSILEFPVLLDKFSDWWLKSAANSLPSEMHHIRHVWVADVARDFFLSSYGFMVQHVCLVGTDTSDDVENQHPDDLSQSSQPRQRSPRIAASSPAESMPSQEVTDAAFQRLRLLAPTLEPGTLGSLRPPKTLSYWPTERGVDTGGYVSSVAVAEEARVSHIKERLIRVETRRRARAERYKLPPFTRQGFPASDNVGEDDSVPEMRRQPPMQIMSSQQRGLDSSQSLGVSGPSVTMSQPVSGVFGGVFGGRKSKKGKRKSGFR
ncbi:hypothetical protein EsDP_00005522 [Epichloe bromicola]|uniref:RNA polymerase I-specific transcription initiation factor RRN6-like protein n=1 Tax=Epichloe bromicola TaxID=79588 RepID=A0ABQ0CUX5_9HYPO